MECDDAAVERQKLVSNDEEDDQATITNLSSSGQAKSIQTPISPVLSNKVFSSSETSRSHNSTSYTTSLGKTIHSDAPPTARLNYINERRVGQDAKTKPKKIPREVPDVRHMERALLGLLDDFHSGKLKAFGSGCTMEQMTSIREQQESLAKLHFDLGNESSSVVGKNTEVQSQNNMKKLVAKLEQLSFSIEKLHSSNVEQ
ncbi:uncharacterized protein LOC131431978 isoform X2 [Malaya genurostris]|uniref:uncharacterized protein LOC131431978 isoform X2 n=1 Tax=Malaya genurostris TaxID=325434 RepID=UPI0026F401F7|nr:uncharacterized protein LOC131431978 isoform X2 [Malaya genurostris]